MKITQALYGEHGVFYSLFDEMKQLVGQSNDLAELRGAAKLLGAVLASHAKLEDEVLLPRLDVGGPVAVMRAEHDQIDRLAVALPSAESVDDLRARLADLLALTESHFAKEEQVLFPMSEQRLDPAEQERLGDQWSELRGVTVR